MHLVDTELTKFARWLEKHGAEVLGPTNEWEVMRVRAEGQTLVAYKNKTGNQNWPDKLEEYREMCARGKAPVLGNSTKQLRGKRLSRVVELGRRDGWNCWYCECALTPPSRPQVDAERLPTVEEICSRQIGGPTHIGNQTLACNECNAKAGNLSVVEKVALRETLQAHREK